jgi:hypothetical protein
MIQVILAAARYLPTSLLDYKVIFEEAVKPFKLLHTNETSAIPTSATYEYFLKACFKLLPAGETRSKLVGKALELCRQRGLVTGQVCREAYKSDPKLVLARFDTTRKGEMEEIVVIPENWCNHVPYRRRIREVKLNGDNYEYYR